MISINAENVTNGVKLFNDDTDTSSINYDRAHDNSPADTVRPAGADTTNVGQINYTGGGLAGADAFAVERFAHIFAIPAGIGLVKKAVLDMYLYNPSFLTPQYLYILDSEGDIVSSGVIAADFGQMLNHTTEYAKIHSSLVSGGAYNWITLNALARAAIQAAAGGFVYFTLRTYDDINKIMPSTGSTEYIATPSGGGSFPAKLYLFPSENVGLIID